MCTDVNIKTEGKSKNTLTKMTKAQLVDIILRKDDIERGLRSDIKSLKSSIDKYIEANKCLEKRASDARRDYEDECDDHVTTYETFKIYQSKANIVFSVMAIIIFAFIIQMILF